MLAGRAHFPAAYTRQPGTGGTHSKHPYLVLGKEADQILLPGLKQDCQVAAVNDLQAQPAGLLHQVPAAAGREIHAIPCPASLLEVTVSIVLSTSQATEPPTPGQEPGPPVACVGKTCSSKPTSWTQQQATGSSKRRHAVNLPQACCTRYLQQQPDCFQLTEP